jgi:hypothetical protein
MSIIPKPESTLQDPNTSEPIQNGPPNHHKGNPILEHGHYVEQTYHPGQRSRPIRVLT